MKVTYSQRVLDYARKHKWQMVFSALLLVFAPIILIHVLFKIQGPVYLQAVWTAGELLDYVGMYTALAPIPLATFAGESTQSVGISFLKTYVGVCLEGAVIVLACIIYAGFVTTPSVAGGEATSVVWSYLGETIFNMLVLVGLIKGSDRLIHEMLGL